MLNSKSAFQQDEYSATWKHKTQGPLTQLFFGNYISETKLNHSVTINCASQKARHFFQKLCSFNFQPSFFVIQSIRNGLPSLR